MLGACTAPSPGCITDRRAMLHKRRYAIRLQPAMIKVDLRPVVLTHSRLCWKQHERRLSLGGGREETSGTRYRARVPNCVAILASLMQCFRWIEHIAAATQRRRQQICCSSVACENFGSSRADV